jgi:hypothetical protein
MILLKYKKNIAMKYKKNARPTIVLQLLGVAPPRMFWEVGTKMLVDNNRSCLPSALNHYPHMQM